MPDIRTITLLPQIQQIVQPAIAKGSNPQSPANLSQLAIGTVLSGFIINRDAQGNPILRTEAGDIAFASNFFLKIGSEVVIRILNTAGNHTASIVSINGLEPELAGTQSPLANDPDVIISNTSANNQAASAQTKTASTQNPLATGNSLNAIVVTPALASPSPAAALPAQTQPLSPGSALLLQVLGEDLLPSTSQALSNLSTPPNPAQIVSTNPLLATLAPKQATVSFDTPTINEAIAMAEQSAAPTAKPTSATANAPAAQTNAAPPNPTLVQSNIQAATAEIEGPLAQVLQATAIESGNPDETLLKTSLGIIRLADGIKIPVGTDINVRVTSVTVPNSYTVALANYANPIDIASLPELSTHWNSLSQINRLLGDDASPLPNANSLANIGSRLLVFITALKTGNFREWYGLRALSQLEEKGFGALIRKAEGEFSAIAKQFAETSPTGWNTLFFPIAAFGEVQQMRMYYKRERKKDEGERKKTDDTRFVIEMNLSQLGELQMDGFVKQTEENLRFDLVIRSLTPLADELQKEILLIYSQTGELTGYSGQLIFQAVKEFPVHPMENSGLAHMDDVLV